MPFHFALYILHVTGRAAPPPICTSHPVLYTSAQLGRGAGVALAGGRTELAGGRTELVMNTYMTSTCYISISMLHGHVYAAVNAYVLLMSMSGLQVYASAACPRTCRTDMDMQHGLGYVQ